MYPKKKNFVAFPKLFSFSFFFLFFCVWHKVKYNNYNSDFKNKKYSYNVYSKVSLFFESLYSYYYNLLLLVK